jgi:hypothetical protein
MKRRLTILVPAIVLGFIGHATGARSDGATMILDPFITGLIALGLGAVFGVIFGLGFVGERRGWMAQGGGILVAMCVAVGIWGTHETAKIFVPAATLGAVVAILAVLLVVTVPFEDEQ